MLKRPSARRVSWRLLISSKFFACAVVITGQESEGEGDGTLSHKGLPSPDGVAHKYYSDLVRGFDPVPSILLLLHSPFTDLTARSSLHTAFANILAKSDRTAQGRELHAYTM